jgi:hypothetical protein
VSSPDAVTIDRDGCAHVRYQGILVTLGPVDGVGDQVQVGVNGCVAFLGADSLTYRIERTAAPGGSPASPPGDRSPSALCGRQADQMRQH